MMALLSEVSLAPLAVNDGDRYETIEESDLVILLISDSAMASNHEKVFSKLKKVREGRRGGGTASKGLGMSAADATFVDRPREGT